LRHAAHSAAFVWLFSLITKIDVRNAERRVCAQGFCAALLGERGELRGLIEASLAREASIVFYLCII
jgi:hypothetical protein